MRIRLLLEWGLVLAVTCGVVALLQLSSTTDRLDNVLYDALIGTAAPSASDRIVLVTIDDPSVAALGRWPWSRERHAQLLDRLARAQVAAVAYDVLFTEAASPQEDAHLARAMKQLGRVALPVLFEVPGTDGRAIDVSPPEPLLARSARSLGHVGMIPDNDGVARSVRLLFPTDTGPTDAGSWRHLMEQTYRIAQGHPSPLSARIAGQPLLIPFRPTGGDFRTVSFASVLTGEVPAQFLKGKIILVGATAAGLGDRFRVPSRQGGLISGVELQANVLNALLADRAIRVPGQTERLLAGMLPLVLLLVSFWWLRPNRAFAGWLLAIGIVLCLPVLLLLWQGIWIAPLPALFGLLLAYPLWSWRRLQALDRALGEELDLFAAEPAPFLPGAPITGYHDPVGGQVARLRLAIGETRNLRRLVSDTIDSVNDPLLVTDFDERPLLSNHAARALFGNAADSGAMPSDLRARLHHALESGDEGKDGDALLHWQDRIYSVRRYPLLDHAGAHLGFITQLADITAARTAEQARQQALEFLSHDMRSPLSSIIALLTRHQTSIGDPALAQRLTTLARKTLKLSDDFVQLARIQVAPFVPEDVDLADLLTQAADELWALATRRDITIDVALAQEELLVRGEPDILLRALTNLLDNAVKFSPPGAVVRCAAHPGEGWVECSIEDEGPGIPEARRNNLFARFGQKTSPDDTLPSSGLGLAFVGGAVSRHGGTILCEQRSPSGTRFSLRLPAAEGG